MATFTITNLPEGIVERLQELVQINVDSARGFNEAANELANSRLVRLCQEVATQRRQQARELSRFVRLHDEVSPRDGSYLAAIHRAWMKMRKALARNDEQAVLAEAECGEEQICRAYEQTRQETDEGPVNELLRQQHAHVQATHNRIRDLRESSS